MRSRRVPVLKLGSSPGGDARSLRCVRKAFASVRKRPQTSASVRKRPQSVRGGSDMPERQTTRKSSRNAKLSSLFTSRITKVSTVTGIGGVVVAKPRTVLTFGLVSGRRVSKVSTVTGIRRGWSRNPELSSLLDSSRVVASQKCQQSQGSGGVVAKPRTVVTFGLVSCLRVSTVSTVTGIGGVVVAKPRTVTGIRGGRGRETQNCRHFWSRLIS